MRFDNFEELWNEFKEEFESMHVSKEAAREVFRRNFATLRTTEKKDVEYLGHSILYKDENVIVGDIDNVSDYVAFSEGRVYVLPDNLVDLTKWCGKAISFGKDSIRIISTTDRNLTITDYRYNTGELVTSIYDGSALLFLRDKGFTFNSIDVIDKELENLTLIPDVTVEILCEKDELSARLAITGYDSSSYVCKTSSIDRDESYHVDSLKSYDDKKRAPYQDLVEATDYALRQVQRKK